MKRYISIALISIMILSALAFTACGGGSFRTPAWSGVFFFLQAKECTLLSGSI